MVATVCYRYPIWTFLDGNLFYEVGNAFDEHLRDFRFERLRTSFGAGVRSSASRDVAFNAMVALGTTPLGSPRYRVDQVRIVFGTNWGF